MFYKKAKYKISVVLCAFITTPKYLPIDLSIYISIYVLI